MIFFSPAKINIGLNVIEKRKDGFHNIETIFYPVELTDIIEFIENNRDETSLAISGFEIQINHPDDNLIIKAYKLLGKNFSLPSLDIHLHKMIPVGSGLGGGSSNAAFMLKSLNEYFHLGLSFDDLLFYARKIGSDCSFFLNCKPALASDRGDKLHNIELDLKNYYIVIIYPSINISSGEAYSLITPSKPDSPLIDKIKAPVSVWQNLIFNDFEKVIFPGYPEIREIKRKLYELGAKYSSMSGSGSSVYGLFENATNLKDQFQGYFVWESKI